MSESEKKKELNTQLKELLQGNKSEALIPHLVC